MLAWWSTTADLMQDRDAIMLHFLPLAWLGLYVVHPCGQSLKSGWEWTAIISYGLSQNSTPFFFMSVVLCRFLVANPVTENFVDRHAREAEILKHNKLL